MPLPLRPLAYHNYRLFFFGQLFSLMGTWMQNVAQQWLVYRITGSAVMLGTIGFLGQIPTFVLASFGGMLADCFQKRSVIILTQALFMLHAFIFAILTLSDLIRPWHIALLASVFGLINAVDVPARQSFVPELVPTQVLLNAIALNSAMFNASRIIGPAIAGVLVAKFGEGYCFLINAFSYATILIGLALMKMPKANPLNAGNPSIARIVDGFKFVIRKEQVRETLKLLGLVSLTGMSYVVLIPIFADRVLHAGAQGVGMLMASSGIGAFFGALSMAMRKDTTKLSKHVAVGAVGFGTCLVMFSLSRLLMLSMASLLLGGFFWATQMTSSNTLIQLRSPSEIRGRVMAAYATMFMGMAPFGSLFAGTIAHWLGAQMAVAIGGSICIVGGLSFAIRQRSH